MDQVRETGHQVNRLPRHEITSGASVVGAPAVISGWRTTRLRSRTDYEKLRISINHRRNPRHVSISTSVSTCAIARGGARVADAIDAELHERGLGDSVVSRRTGCHGLCEVESVVVVYPEGIVYQRVTPSDIPEIISESVLKSNVLERLLYTEASSGRKCIRENEIPFYRNQYRLLLDGNSLIDPCCIEDYIALGGYSATARGLLEMRPEDVIDEMAKSGLRSRGGTAVSTSAKWEACRHPAVSQGMDSVICNANEGDPGPYIGRSLLEGNPHRIIEGMIIGAYVADLHLGQVFIRGSHSLSISNMATAIDQARGYGLLGKDILSSGFDFDMDLYMNGAGFTCDDSSVNMDNAETWSNVPIIIGKGAESYSQIGSRTSKGTKVFSLAGTVRNTGLVEVPMGTSLRELIYDIGGGIRGNREIKAIHVGGPVGGFLPSSQLDLPVDFDSLADAGVLMGSGSIVVMDEGNCMVDMARYFTGFLAEEKCGKCTGCHPGLDIMKNTLTRISHGGSPEGDVIRLERLGNAIKEGSPCHMGANAANAALSAIRHFGEEFTAHASDRRCPAAVCKSLMTLRIDAV